MDFNLNMQRQYRKFLLNRVTATSSVINYIDHCSINVSEASSHSFHKVMVHNWTASEYKLFKVLNEYFESKTIPVLVKNNGDITSFYTNNINFISKIVKNDFIFPYLRNMYNIDILLNDKTSVDCFDEAITISNIISSVLSQRFNEKCELDLSDFCNDPEFKQRNITFYNFSNLFYNQISIMNKLGKETRSLNLSNNNLRQIPIDVLDFFKNGDLTSVNLSNNDISSVTHLVRMSSKIEKLWLEGNPLCESLEPSTYIKQIIIKFPRLTELDGIKINNFGINVPFFKNFTDNPDRKTKMVVEKFLSLYFTNYDCQMGRLGMFYDENATLTMQTGFQDSEDKLMAHYTIHSRNMMNPVKRMHVLLNNKIFVGRKAISSLLLSLPKTVHDPTTFNVDVLAENAKSLIIIVDGTYKEVNPVGPSKVHFRFRRTFVFNINSTGGNSVYQIVQEMYSITSATKEQIECSFIVPVRNLNSLTLINPDVEEKETMQRIFSHLTQLKKSEAEVLLLSENWDLRNALKKFYSEMKQNKISSKSFTNVDEEDISECSSVWSDDID